MPIFDSAVSEITADTANNQESLGTRINSWVWGNTGKEKSSCKTGLIPMVMEIGGIALGLTACGLAIKKIAKITKYSSAGIELALVREHGKAVLKHGPESFPAAEALCKLSNYYKSNGQLQKSFTFMSAADLVSQQAMSHLDDGLLHVVGEIPRKLPLLIRAKDAITRFMADQYLKTADHSLGLLNSTKKYEKAASLYERCYRPGVELTEKQINNMRYAYAQVSNQHLFKNGDICKSYQTLHKEAQLTPKRWDSDYIDYPFTEYRLARTCKDLNLYGEAEHYQKKILDWQIRNLDDDLWRAKDTLVDLICGLVKQKRIDEAKQLGRVLTKLPTGVKNFDSRNVSPKDFYAVMKDGIDVITKPSNLSLSSQSESANFAISTLSHSAELENLDNAIKTVVLHTKTIA